MEKSNIEVMVKRHAKKKLKWVLECDDCKMILVPTKYREMYGEHCPQCGCFTATYKMHKV